MSSLNLTREWLQTVLRPYAAKERIISEVLEILASRKTLSVKTDAFTYDNGQTALLLLLHGTLPINYRGATYQIPLHVWVPHDYPRNPPLAFVVPTKEMGVRKGREVEPGGRVKEDVVQGWWAGWEPKSIEVLLRHLAGVFSATPPVFARPLEAAGAPARGAGQTGTPASPVQNGYAAPGPSHQPPPPPQRPTFQPPQPQYQPPQAGPPTEYLPQYHSAQTPPPHPYPHQGGRARQTSASYPQSSGPPASPHSVPPVPYRPQVGPRQGSLPPTSPGGGRSGPMPPQRPNMPPQMQPQGTGTGYGAPPGQAGHVERYASPQPVPGPYHPQRGASSSSPLAGQGPPVPVGPPNGYHPGQAQPAQPGPSYQGQQYPGQQAASQSQPQYQPPTQPAGPSSTSAAAHPRQYHPPTDLLSSSDASPTLSPTGPSTNPPPVPPSKPPPPSTMHLHSILLPHLSASLPPLLSSLHASRQHLLERKEDLESGEPAIKDEMARLQAVLKVCEATAGKLGEIVARGEARVGELESRGEVGVDEVVCGISIVHNQLIDLVAEDNAIDDTIYHITKAFEAERLDLDRFLKSIRSLAREQYMKRALIERILQGMGQTQGW